MTIINNIMLERRNFISTLNKLKSNRVIAICAPAGFGKTVAVTQWLGRETRAKAFFSVDEYDNNFAGFCERFCNALCACQPQNKTLSSIISQPTFQSAPDTFALRAISVLSSRKQAVLVIDDLHLIHDNTVLQFLLILIKRLPKNFQVVLISRHDLPLSLSELWIKGQATRISAEQLLFTNEDIIALYKKRGNQITQEQAGEVSKKTQGWAIGINALLLSGKQSFDNYDEMHNHLD